MDLSPIGAAVLITREGRRLKADRDSVRIWTKGIARNFAAGAPLVYFIKHRKISPPVKIDMTTANRTPNRVSLSDIEQ
jgi:hypothetical protein